MSDGEPKPTSQLLDEIQKADATALKDVSTQESNQSAKHDMTMVRKSFHYYFPFPLLCYSTQRYFHGRPYSIKVTKKSTSR